MRRLILLSCLLAVAFATNAQDNDFQYEKKDIATPISWVFDPMKIESDWITSQAMEMPEPGGMSETMRKKVDAERARRNKIPVGRANYTGNPTAAAQLDASILRTYNGGAGGGTPNDNHIAVGNDGKFINVLNTAIRVYNDTGKVLKAWSLEFFVNPPNKKIDPMPALTRVYDPRVLYDPIRDRWIILFMHGTSDVTSFIVVGFSSSSNPLDPWNIYKIPGKPTKDTVWSDYPIAVQNGEDLFFTVNLIGNDATWEEGFTEAVIWQLRKEDGFNGDTLHKTVYTGIKHNGTSLRSICSIQNGPYPAGTDNFFVTVRPIDLENDTVFLLRITNTQESGKAILQMKLMKTDLKYGFPPSALQPDTSYKLRTNDARALSGIRTGTTIQFLQNSKNFKTFQAHLTHQTIYNIDANPFIKGNMIADDSLEMGYPAIAPAGGDENDLSSIITFVYSSPWHYPGTAVIYRNRYGEYSNIVKVKKGQSLIHYNFIPKGEQRWGDYEGIQWKYNEPGVFYLVGSYGISNNMNAWIARVKLKDGVWDDPVSEVRVFPVPAVESLFTEITITDEGIYTLSLYDMLGQKVRDKPSQFLVAGSNLLKIDSDAVAPGEYVLHVTAPDGKLLHTQKVVIL
jgi:hypothetical protein